MAGGVRHPSRRPCRERREPPVAEPPLYLIALCEGRDCVPLTSLDNVPLTELEAVAFLALLAARLRAEGAIGRLVLLDGATRRIVARSRVWP